MTAVADMKAPYRKAAAQGPHGIERPHLRAAPILAAAGLDGNTLR